MWAAGFVIVFILTTCAMYQQHQDKIAWENHQRNIERWKRYYEERRNKSSNRM